MRHIKKKNKQMTMSTGTFFVFIIAVIALVLGGSAPALWAEEDEIPFDEASIFFELNDTDGDLGIHALIDGEPWKKLEIEDPNEREMLYISIKGRLRRQGLTEIFFESAEPTFDELSPEEFFDRFPEGEYEIEGETLEGDELESEVEVSHVMPAPPGNIKVNRQSAAVDCDAEELPSVRRGRPVIISWDPVTTSHPTIGEDGSVEVVRYQAVTEWENEDEVAFVFSADFPPSNRRRMSVTVPPQFIAAGLAEGAEEFKFEILVRADSGNQTAVESCFEIE
jgi:hypothetical protein